MFPKGSTLTGTRTGIDQLSRTRGATTRPASVGLTHFPSGRWASKAAVFVNAHPHWLHSTSEGTVSALYGATASSEAPVGSPPYPPAAVRGSVAAGVDC